MIGQSSVGLVFRDEARAQRVVWRGGPFGSTTAELIRVKRHKFPDAHRELASHPLHTVCQSVVPTGAVQLAHRHQMMGKVIWQPELLQRPFPIVSGNVSVSDLTVQRVR